MKERPLIFGADSVRALLAGTKTQTRRVVAAGSAFFGSAPRRFFEHADFSRAWIDGTTGNDWYLHVPAHEAPGCAECHRMGWEGTAHRLYSRYGTVAGWDQKEASDYTPPASRLWVRETWLKFPQHHWEDSSKPADWLSDRYGPPRRNACAYKADTTPEGEEVRADYGYAWRSPILMPRWASRLTLEITSVRVQRLQEITEADAVAELGCVGTGPNNHQHLRRFREGWDALNAGRGFGWSANPWVWAITFRRAA